MFYNATCHVLHIYSIYDICYMLCGKLVIFRPVTVRLAVIAAIGIPLLIGQRHLHSFQKVWQHPDRHFFFIWNFDFNIRGNLVQTLHNAQCWHRHSFGKVWQHRDRNFIFFWKLYVKIPVNQIQTFIALEKSCSTQRKRTVGTDRNSEEGAKSSCSEKNLIFPESVRFQGELLGANPQLNMYFIELHCRFGPPSDF